jgi:Raf kinase inhibitor-like YbhB/YbcL family protein
VSAPRSALVAPLLAVLLAATACDTGDGKELREPTEAQRAVMSTTTTSTTSTLPGLPADAIVDPSTTTSSSTVTVPFSLQLPWPPSGPIDVRFTCDGEDRSPLLIWSTPPVGTVELALLVTDDDADGFVHWAVAGIPATAGEVGEGAQISSAIEGRNDFGNSGWGGPCPPAGASHTYRFSLYALSQQAELPGDFTGDDLAAVATSASLGVAESTGEYTRAG